MQCQQVVEQSKADVNTLQPKSVEQNVVPSKQSKPPGEESATKIDLFPNQVLSGTKGQTTVEKSKQPIVASFSVCSGNGTNQGSEEPNQNLKRKRKDTDDSECHSEVCLRFMGFNLFNHFLTSFIVSLH